MPTHPPHRSQIPTRSSHLRERALRWGVVAVLLGIAATAVSWL